MEHADPQDGRVGLGPDGRIPTGIEPLRGVRAWRIDPAGRLCGMVIGRHHWRTSDTALCRPFFDQPCGRRSPDEGCNCGLYARKPGQWDQSWSRQSLRAGTAVLGEVDLWGRVLEGSRGFRAQHARIVAIYHLWGDRDRAMVSPWDVAETYQVPVVDPPHWAVEQLRQPEVLYSGIPTVVASERSKARGPWDSFVEQFQHLIHQAGHAGAASQQRKAGRLQPSDRHNPAVQPPEADHGHR